MKKVTLIFVMSLGFVLFIPSPTLAGKGEKEAIEKLTSEVLILERQVRDMQEANDRTNGQLITLVGQSATRSPSPAKPFWIFKPECRIPKVASPMP